MAPKITCTVPYCRYNRIMVAHKSTEQVTHYADMFAAMGPNLGCESCSFS